MDYTARVAGKVAGEDHHTARVVIKHVSANIAGIDSAGQAIRYSIRVAEHELCPGHTAIVGLVEGSHAMTGAHSVYCSQSITVIEESNGWVQSFEWKLFGLHCPCLATIDRAQ